MQGLLILLLLCSSGNGFGLKHLNSKDRVGKVEFNTVYVYKESQGKVVPQYTQMILWEWNPEHRRYDVIQSFTVEDNDSLNLNKINDTYFISIISMDHVLFSFQTKNLVYTKCWIEDDPEIENDTLLPRYDRKQLTGERLVK